MKTLTGVPCNSQGQILHQENGSSFPFPSSGMTGLERSTVQWLSDQKDLDLTLSCATLPAERLMRKLMNISEPHFPHLSSGDENNELL